MLAIAKAKPESRNAGRKVEIIAIWLASNCCRASALIRIPCASVPTTKTPPTLKSSVTLPRNGTSKRNTAMSTAITMLAIPMAE